MEANINKKVARIDTATRRERQHSPEIVQPISAVRHPFSIKIFKVQSAAMGDGVYNCYEQKLLSAKWEDTAGDAKFSDKNSTNVEVLNLHEFNPEAEQHNLSAGVLFAAWQMVDDEGNVRWVGKVIIPWNICSPEE